MTAPGDHEGALAGSASFDRFRLIFRERRLERNGITVPVGGRALDILIRLLIHAGQVVSKHELSQAAWPGHIVEEGNLRFHIASLRKLLDVNQAGGSLLKTVAGRGYSLATDVRWLPRDDAAPQGPAGMAPALPALPRRMVASPGLAREVKRQIGQKRLLTLVGPAGIGKTTLALHLAHDLAPAFAGDVAFVDLGAINDRARIAEAIMTAAGHRPAPAEAIRDAAASLPLLPLRRPMLLILDGCDHMIDAVAQLAGDLLETLPELTILATSREALRIESEAIHRLFPLPCPPRDQPLTPAQLMTYPAAELLIGRLRELSVGFHLPEDDVPAIVEICHRLDGIPLALELAAGCIPSHGLRQTMHLLEGHFRLLWKGRRSAPPRHQTLCAALDWSYDLLSEAEQKVLRRLSVLTTSFSHDLAQHVAGTGDLSQDDIMQALASLLDKSLLHLDEKGTDPVHYRLLDTTRVYAYHRLKACPDFDATVQRHGHLPHVRSLERPSPPDGPAPKAMRAPVLRLASSSGAVAILPHSPVPPPGDCSCR